MDAVDALLDRSGQDDAAAPQDTALCDSTPCDSTSSSTRTQHPGTPGPRESII